MNFDDIFLFSVEIQRNDISTEFTSHTYFDQQSIPSLLFSCLSINLLNHVVFALPSYSEVEHPSSIHRYYLFWHHLPQHFSDIGESFGVQIVVLKARYTVMLLTPLFFCILSFPILLLQPCIRRTPSPQPSLVQRCSR